MEEGREERKVNQGERVHKYSGRQRIYRENAKEEKIQRGESERKEAEAVGGSELREREIKACQRKTGGKGNR